MAVNLSPVGGAAVQFFDNNGVPLSGGFLYSYAAGTSTPIATYTTQAGNIANSNPIVLDSAGRVSNEIWLLTNYSYKFVLQNSSSIQIGSYDNISGINNFSSFYASTGSSLIGYNQGNANAVTTTVQAKLQENISVLDFGADKTGVANSTTAFTNAGSSSGNVEVSIPSGTYSIVSSPTASGNVTWMFEKGSTLTGAGVLPGNILSRSAYAPAWVNSTYNAAYAYMPPNSVLTSFPKSGNLGFSALGNSTLSTGATIGFSSAMVNNSAGVGSTWNFYGSTIANTGATGASTQCIELDILSSSTNVGTAIGLAINAGGEAANMISMGYSFQSVGAAIQIGVNNIGNYANVNFSKGLYITNNAIESTFNTAINLSQNHAIRWTGSGFSQLTSIQSTVSLASQSTSLAFTQYGFFVNNAGNYPLLQVNNSTSTSATNYFLFDAAVAGSTPTINAIGVDTNVDLKLFPKGTGKIDIATTGLVGTAGSIAYYLPIKVNGTIYKLALYNV